MKQVRSRAAAAALVALGLWPAAAAAQSFNYRMLNGTRVVRLAIDDDEFVWDSYPDDTGVPVPPAYAPNLDHSRRIVANPFARSIRFDLNRFDLNPAPCDGAAPDFLRLGWAGEFPAVIRTGVWANPQWTVPAQGTHTLMSPGALLRFTTGAAPLEGSRYADCEGSGFRVNDVAITGDGTIPSFEASTVTAHEQVTGVLWETDDLVDFNLPPRAIPTMVAVWLRARPTAGEVRLYARCGGLPTDSAWDARVGTADQYPLLLDLEPCASRWYVSVTNTVPSPQVFHVTARPYRPDREFRELKIGVAWNADEATLAAIRASFTRAAWQLYGASEGTSLVRTFRLINNANQCDDGWPADEYACEGGGCQFCLHPNCDRSNSNGLGKVTLCEGDWLRPRVITHEMGHSLLGLPDEYEDIDRCPAAPGAIFSLPLCGHSLMSGQQDNKYSFCTALAHRTSVQDYRGDPAPPVPSINGPISYDCDGNRHWTGDTPAWARLNGHTPEDLPATQSPSNYAYGHFALRNDVLGFFSRVH